MVHEETTNLFESIGKKYKIMFESQSASLN